MPGLAGITGQPMTRPGGRLTPPISLGIPSQRRMSPCREVSSWEPPSARGDRPERESSPERARVQAKQRACAIMSPPIARSPISFAPLGISEELPSVTRIPDKSVTPLRAKATVARGWLNTWLLPSLRAQSRAISARIRAKVTRICASVPARSAHAQEQ
jgi:hypothetical protein